MANRLRLLGERLQSRGPEQAGLGCFTTRSHSPYSSEEWWHFFVHFFGSEDAISERLLVNREAFEDALAFVAAVGAGSRGRIISIKQLFFWFGFPEQKIHVCTPETPRTKMLGR